MAFSETKVNRRQFLSRSVKTVCVSGVGLGLYAWRVEPHWVEWVHRPMPLVGLPQVWQGKTVVQISDLHVGPTVSSSYLRSVLAQVAELEPHLIVVTGDWMTCVGDEQVAETVRVASELPSMAPVYSVLGNHDYGRGFRDYTAADKLAGGLRDAGIHVLRNERVELDGLHLAGVDDLWARRCQLEPAIGDVPAGEPAITLCHNPDVVDLHEWRAYRGWILAGHTHGGQCCFPGVGAPIVPIRNKRYIAGEVNLGDGRTLYVNRALGYKHRVRFMVRPEVTVFRLKAV